MKLGKLPARHDHRMPRMHQVFPALPPPPAASDWMADVPEWYMLANDQNGCCVEAAVMHYLRQQSCYVTPGQGLVPTDQETLRVYSDVAGFVPGNAATDQGTYMAGPGGMMEHWVSKGVMCGGALHKASAVMLLDTKNPTAWRQAISTFGAVFFGMQLPAGIAEAVDLPYVWRDVSGSIVGGHEVLCPKYQVLDDGCYYSIITWGQECRVTEEALLQIVDEVYAVYDPISLDARGVNAAGVDEAALLAAVRALGG